MTSCSPARWPSPYPGKPITAAIRRRRDAVFEDFRYVREIDGGRDHALVFEATVDGKAIYRMLPCTPTTTV